MMQPPPHRDDDGDDSVTANSLADSKSTAASNPHLRPILVGYAFGPKKMSTMGLIMAEASRAQLSTVVTAELPVAEPPPQEHMALTTAALKQAQSPNPNRKLVLSMSGGPNGGLRNIVRYLRSSCSSVASDDTLTTATTIPSAAATSCSSKSRAHQQQQQRRHPVHVSFVPLDLDSPLEEQHGGNFDAILHKLTEDILCLSTLPTNLPHKLDEAQLQAISRVDRLEQYQKDHPYCSLVDHPSHVQVVMSRSDIAHTLAKCLVGVSSKSGIPVRTPRFEIYDGNDTCLTMPLIAKPLTAAGTKKSHCMGVVLRESGLNQVQETPCLLQEYVNHNACLFKVYVLGDHVSVFERPSLPNLPQDAKMGCAFLQFDSQRPYPTLENFGLQQQQRDAKRTKLMSLEISVDEVRPVVSVLKQAFGLELFGFDILVTSTSVRELLVVDVNYFPSYKEVSNFPSLLANYLTQRAIDGRIRNPIVATR